MSIWNVWQYVKFNIFVELQIISEILISIDLSHNSSNLFT